MNIVLGAGLTGLIAGYITGYPVLGREIGGQLNSPFPLGPRILERTPETEWLLANLGIQSNPKTFKVGYYDHGRLTDDPPVGFRETYYKKTRKDGTVTEDCMSGNKKHIVGWDIAEIKLIDLLKSRVNLIPEIATKIDTKLGNILLSDGKSCIVYDNCINTIPANIFCRLADINLYEFRAHTTIFALVKPISNIAMDNPYKYIYFAEEEYPFHRLTKLDDRHAVLEFREDRWRKYDGHDIETSIGYFEVLDIIEHANCQIIDDLDLKGLWPIKFIGRYAQWKHGVKVEHTIRELVDMKPAIRRSMDANQMGRSRV